MFQTKFFNRTIIFPSEVSKEPLFFKNKPKRMIFGIKIPIMQMRIKVVKDELDENLISEENIRRALKKIKKGNSPQPSTGSMGTDKNCFQKEFIVKQYKK